MTTSDEDFSVVGTEDIYSGYAFDVRVDQVRMPDGTVARRDVIDHVGAVGVVALDDDGTVVMVRQYRPAVGTHLLELPAGLLDQAGEPALASAQRELLEEAAITAERWHTLVDLHTSPGMSDEAIRVYLARGLAPVPEEDRYAGEHEERTMEVHRYQLEELVELVLAGAVTNGPAVAGILAAAAARRDDWASLRPADAAWPARPDRVPDHQ